MKIEEFTKGLSYLGLMYNKTYSQLETTMMYDFFKEYNYETFTAAIKNIVKTSSFIPKVADLIKECDNCRVLKKNEVAKFMLDEGYFNISRCNYPRLSDEHAYRNYNKTLMWIERGTVPDWLQEDINYYYLKMKNKALGNSQQALLED